MKDMHAAPAGDFGEIWVDGVTIIVLNACNDGDEIIEEWQIEDGNKQGSNVFKDHNGPVERELLPWESVVDINDIDDSETEDRDPNVEEGNVEVVRRAVEPGNDVEIVHNGVKDLYDFFWVPSFINLWNLVQEWKGH